MAFQIDNWEEEWTYSQPFDYIHSRMNNSSIMDWKKFVQQSFDNLEPGGWFEIQDFALPLSDDGTLTPETSLQKAMDLLGEAAAKSNHAFVDLDSLKGLLAEAGFLDIVVAKDKWPSSAWLVFTLSLMRLEKIADTKLPPGPETRSTRRLACGTTKTLPRAFRASSWPL